MPPLPAPRPYNSRTPRRTPSRPARPLGLALVFLLAFLNAPARLDAAELSPASKEKPAPPVPAGKNFQTHWQDESQYIVETVAADLAEMAYFAQHRTVLPSTDFPVEAREVGFPGGFAYSITVKLGPDGQLTCIVPMTTPIWAPATYLPLVKALVEKLRLGAAPPRPGAPSTELLRTLTSPTAETLATLDLKLSAQLAQQFTSSARHEDAALLLAAFTLRETKGIFFQIRSELCRITAHLAFAAELRGAQPATPGGRMAEAALTSLYNNQTAALLQLTAIPDAADTVIWKRALRMHATGDYRLVKESETPTFLERREWFRARASSLGLTRAWAELNLDEEKRPPADWTRFACAEPQPIGVGHALLRLAVPLELHEIAAVYFIEQGQKLSEAELAPSLNAEPERCVTGRPAGQSPVKIIGWGRWAAFLQRHCCTAISTNFDFIQRRWGVPDEARSYRDAMDERFSALRLYPFVRRQNATDETYYRQAQDAQMALVRSVPHHVPAEVWNRVGYTVPFCPLYIPPPHCFINEWHSHNPPPGTAYNPLPRLNHPSLVSQPDTVKRLEALLRLAPYDTDLIFNLLRIRDGGNSTTQQISTAYAAVMDFDPAPYRRLAKQNKADPLAHEKYLRIAASINPSDYEMLAEFYLETGREKDAATTFAQWISHESDSVAIASQAGWLIDYYERTGESASATQLADRVAEVYSTEGLLAKARLLERRRDYAGAIDCLQKNAERYNDSIPLIGLLVRVKTATGSSQYDAMLDELIRTELPGGLKKITNRSPLIGPKAGVLVQTDNDAIRQAGLQTGDIIVGSRGYVVANLTGYKFLRELEDTPFTLEVWRKGRYVTLPPLPAKFRLGVNLPDYHPR